MCESSADLDSIQLDVAALNLDEVARLDESVLAVQVRRLREGAQKDGDTTAGFNSSL